MFVYWVLVHHHKLYLVTCIISKGNYEYIELTFVFHWIPSMCVWMLGCRYVYLCEIDLEGKYLLKETNLSSYSPLLLCHFQTALIKSHEGCNCSIAALKMENVILKEYNTSCGSLVNQAAEVVFCYGQHWKGIRFDVRSVRMFWWKILRDDNV